MDSENRRQRYNDELHGYGRPFTVPEDAQHNCAVARGEGGGTLSRLLMGRWGLPS